MAGAVGVFDERLIGTRIAFLGDHRVYHYGGSSVIKFSQFDWCRTAEDLLGFYCDEVSALEVIFAEFYLATEVVSDRVGKRVGLVQPFVVGAPLTQRHLRDGSISSQLEELFFRLQRASTDGEYIDLVGGGRNLFSALLGNVLVTEDDRLVIIDASILRTSDFAPWCRPFVSMVILLGNKIQTRRFTRAGLLG